MTSTGTEKKKRVGRATDGNQLTREGNPGPKLSREK